MLKVPYTVSSKLNDYTLLYRYIRLVSVFKFSISDYRIDLTFLYWYTSMCERLLQLVNYFP